MCVKQVGPTPIANKTKQSQRADQFPVVRVDMTAATRMKAEFVSALTGSAQ